MKRILIRIVLAFLALIALVLSVLAIQYFGGQPMGFFAGTAPTNLGFNNGKFAVPSWKPNWVSSTVDKTDPHYIAPFAIESFVSRNEISAESRADTAFATLHAIVMEANNITHKKNAQDYLYVEFKTPGLGFVDDVEIALDRSANVIHVKSGSRLGVRDFNVNRKRIEALRELFSKPFVPKDKNLKKPAL
jgi:uncharacterized protein (DUF1499 family)